MSFIFANRLVAHRYKIYEETLYSSGRWIKTKYTIKKRYVIFGIPIWLYVWDKHFNSVEFSTKAEAHIRINKIEKSKKRTGWTKVLIDQERFDH